MSQRFAFELFARDDAVKAAARQKPKSTWVSSAVKRNSSSRLLVRLPCGSGNRRNSSSGIGGALPSNSQHQQYRCTVVWKSFHLRPKNAGGGLKSSSDKNTSLAPIVHKRRPSSTNHLLHAENCPRYLDWWNHKFALVQIESLIQKVVCCPLRQNVHASSLHLNNKKSTWGLP